MAQRQRIKLENWLRAHVGIPGEGQAMAEYALLLAGVSLTAIVAVNLVGTKIGMLLNRVVASLS